MPNLDLTAPIPGGVLNIRVGAIIRKDSRILMVSNPRNDYCYSVGGRVQFGETAGDAIKREVLEETGMALEVDRLGFVHENFFLSDTKGDRAKVYEISFFFYMKVPDDFEPVCMSFCEGGERETLEWVDLDSDRRFFPEFFRTELKTPEQQVKHIVTREPEFVEAWNSKMQI